MAVEVIDIKTTDEINLIEKSAKIASDVLRLLKRSIVPGISTKQLDILAHETIFSFHAEPAFLGYRDYPATICVSINNELVHGIPSGKRVLREGDLVTVDLGVKYKGFYGDIAETIPVGKIDQKKLNLLKVTFGCFGHVLKYCHENNRVGDISCIIQSYVESNGYSVIRDYVGHGIGRKLHEKPEIPNFGKAGTGPRLVNGMVICIEPMVAEGSYEVRTLEDNWTVATVDNKLCAHYEHMMLITDNGCKVLTEFEPAYLNIH